MVLAFGSLVGLFFFLNFFLYIPRQQAQYNQKVFRVLSEVSRDFASTLDGQILSAVKTIAKYDSIETKNIPADTPTIKNVTTYFFRGLDNSADKSKKYRYEYQFKKDSIRVNLIDTSKDKKDSNLTLALNSIIKPNYEHLHKDLFDLLLLVKRSEVKSKEKTALKDNLIFRIGDIPTRYGFIHDTLFKDKNYGQFSTIDVVNIRDQSYLAFSLPFQFHDDELIITGLLSEKEYRNEAARFSKSTLIIITALLAFVIVSMPIIKLKISGRRERVSINEVRILIIVFVVTPVLVMLALGTTLIYQYADKDSDRTLQVLETMVEHNLEQELSLVLEQLKLYDRITADESPITQTTGSPASTQDYYQRTIRNIHKQIDKKNWWDTSTSNIIYTPTRYFNLDDIYWANDSGKQIGKWFLLKEKPTYLDISSRTYFQKIKNEEYNYFPGTRIPFYIEPTISWSTNDYSVNIVTTSSQNLNTKQTGTNKDFQAILIGMAARLYAIYHPVIAKGYHFAIIKRDGSILFHSQTERALHENILEEANLDPALLQAINRNDSVSLSNIELYDRDTKMRAKPWRLMPEFYLLTYFEKREQNLFVFHIAAFTLLAVFMLLLLLLLFHLFISRLWKSRSTQFVRNYPSQWMRPSKSRSGIYSQTLAFFTAIVLIALLCLLFTTAINSFRTDAYLFQALYFLPFMITVGYFLVTRNRLLQEHKNRLSLAAWLNKNRDLLLCYLSFVILSLIMLSMLLHDCSNFHLDSLLASLLTLSVPALAFMHHRQSRYFNFMNRQSYLKKYNLLLGACIFLVAVVPTLGMMYYAFRQEQVLRIKAEQLNAAREVNERRQAINQDLRRNKIAFSKSTEGATFLQHLKFKADHGIYLPYQEISLLNKQYDKNICARRPDQPPVYTAATRLLLLPADHADYFQNNSQHLWLDSAKVILQSTNTIDQRDTSSLLFTATHKVSPAVAEVAQNPITYLWLLLALIFFVLHFRTIQSTVKKIFLLNYFNSDLLSNNYSHWCNTYLNLADKDLDKWKFLGEPQTPASITEIQKIEENIRNSKRAQGLKYLQLQQLLSPAYEAMWKQLSEEEQLVLYDFALDGFTNFRITDIIYSLIQKGLIFRTADGHLEVMTHSFRNFLLGKTATPEVKNLEEKFKVNTSWKSLKNVLLAILLAVTIFLFATQRDLTDKMLAIISGLVTLVPLVVKLFDRPASNSNTAQNG